MSAPNCGIMSLYDVVMGRENILVAHELGGLLCGPRTHQGMLRRCPRRGIHLLAG